MLILRRHPAWTYDDLQRTPQLILDIERELDEVIEERKARKRRRGSDDE